MTEPAQAAPVRALSNDELVAVAALWKRTGRELVTRFNGRSMLPTIPDGATVVLSCTDDVIIGDIVAYAYGDRVIVHRIVACREEGFLTRGDANWLPDPVVVERHDLIGKVAAVERDSGRVLPPPPASSFAASLVLILWRWIARVGGTRAAVHVMARIRGARQRLRIVRSG